MQSYDLCLEAGWKNKTDPVKVAADLKAMGLFCATAGYVKQRYYQLDLAASPELHAAANAVTRVIHQAWWDSLSPREQAISQNLKP